MVGLWPAFGDALASNNTAWAAKVLRRSMLLAAAVALIAVVALSVAIPWLMRHWLKATFEPSWSLIAALAAWTVIDAVANVAAAFMNGANILRAQLIFAIGMAGSAFAGKWVLTPSLGATGAVVSTILAYCAISVPGQIFIFKRVFKPKDLCREPVSDPHL
jgi:O-antigen/teichoic acid export membrane protein